MTTELMERRSLEKLIRGAEAEEHALERRLDRLEVEQCRARRSIEARLGDQPLRHFVGELR